ncbi:hypothetical protein Desca_2421 [Desulfotomaculum nigrificans CO-1-SRB]|uniref:Lipoprotein n=1 Tax=Desulfotomaculum nigrificans (strain DSM 14880 / VKM B-2319 / CO-1-SRB) TaxID=868595 RepID=F6B3U0_DESCC|nr:hypothetical protein [Desulfotomaculum nigrificans]AEF95249.1 hypothetical protein Desca_2421 [Desulfotomaculum nigrificans CO-1-SRB]
MISLKNILVVSALVASLAVSGCGTAKPAEQGTAQPKPQTATTETKQQTLSISQGTQNMRDVLKEMKNELANKDEAKVIKVSEKLEENWKIFEDSVKDKSPDLYEKVEKPLGAIQAGVKVKPLDAKTLTASIDELDKTLAKVQELK